MGLNGREGQRSETARLLNKAATTGEEKDMTAEGRMAEDKPGDLCDGCSLMDLVPNRADSEG